MKRCPNCAEEIQDEAVVCRHCGGRIQKCPYCAEEISSTAKICQHCGKKLGWKPIVMKMVPRIALLVVALIVVSVGVDVGIIQRTDAWQKSYEANMKMLDLGFKKIQASAEGDHQAYQQLETAYQIQTQLADMLYQPVSGMYGIMWFFVWGIGLPVGLFFIWKYVKPSPPPNRRSAVPARL